MAQAVIRSTNYTMMHGDHRALQYTLKNMGQVSGVHHLRLFDKQGCITFSQNKGEIGSMIDTQEEACIICHQQGRTLITLGRSERVRRFEAKNGKEVIALTTPIPNRPQCAQKCHAHPPEKKILGILDVGMTTSQLQQELRGVVQGLALFWFLLNLLVLGLICALILTLSRLADRAETYKGWSHLGYLTGFYLFYFLSHALQVNAWAVIIAGFTILGLEYYSLYSYTQEAIAREKEILQRLQHLNQDSAGSDNDDRGAGS